MATPRVWTDDSGIPINAANLNAMEADIVAAAFAPVRSVPGNGDLNSWLEPGVSRISTPDSGTIANMPPGTRVASEVINFTTGPAGDSVLTQQLNETGDSARQFWRPKFTSGNTFGPWAYVGRKSVPITEWHVFLAVGQSNMSGRAIVSAASGGKYMQSRIFQFGFSHYALEPATVPLDMHDTSSGLSPATVFVNNYLMTQPDNVGAVIVAAAHGGTGFTTSTSSLTWSPNVATNPTLDLPKIAVDQTKAAITAAKADGSAVTLKGILWHQGENNSTMARATYESNLDTLIAYFRAQLNDDKLPFIVGQMCPEGIAANTGRANIDAAHKGTPGRVPYTGFAAATTGGYNPGDTTHMSKFGVDFLGRTYLEAYEQVQASSPAVAAVPGAVANYITTDPTVIQSVADQAASNGGLLPKWKPNTAYTAGQQVVTPDGDIVTRAVNGTSGSSFTMTNWTPSATASNVLAKLNTADLDSSNAALVNNGSSSWWVTLLAFLKTVFLGKREIVVSVTEFGAVGDYINNSNKGTDNLAAFNAAFAYASSITGYAVKLYIPAGKYRLSDTWNVYRSSASVNTLTIEGADALSTFLVSDFFGAGKDLVASVDPAGVSRSAATNVRRLQFTYSSLAGATPVYLNILGGGESRYEELRFNSGNNTHFRASSLQNVRMRDIVSFYGGDHFNYKATDAITFDVTSGGAVTASAAIFTAGDVGKIFNVYPATEDQRIKYTISAVTDSTHATVTIGTGATILAATAAKGYFEAAQGTMTAGSAVLTADAPCFTASDVGRVIYVRGARSGSWGAGNLRASIASYTNSSTVTLSVAADITVTRVPFTTPAVDFYSTPGASVLNADSNDVKIDLLHIENNYGVGLCTTPNIFFHMDKMKIHGEHDPIDARHSTAAMWLDDYAGTINGELDGASTGDCRIHVSNMNDTLTFEWLATRRVRGETIFKAETMTDPKGFVEVKSFISYKATTSGNPYDLVTDPNTSPRIVFNGLVNMLGDTKVPRFYVGRDSYFLPDGSFVNGPTTSPGLFASILSGQNGARLLFEDYGTKKYSLGNVAGGGTGFTFVDETAAAVRLLINTTGSVLPGANNTQPLGSSSFRWSEVVGTIFRPGSGTRAWTSGTGSPEGVLTASVGSLWTREDGGAGTTLYVKETGTGNTGWVAK